DRQDSASVTCMLGTRSKPGGPAMVAPPAGAPHIIDVYVQVDEQPASSPATRAASSSAIRSVLATFQIYRDKHRSREGALVRRRGWLILLPHPGGYLMKTSLRMLTLATALLASSATAFAAAPKTYQVTGPIVEVTDDTITVMKGKEKWEIARDKDTKV